MKEQLPQLRLKQLRLKHPGFIRSSATGRNADPLLMLQNYQKSLIHLLRNRPGVFLGGVWLAIVLVSLVALGSLLSPSSSSQRSPAQIAADAQAVVAPEPQVDRPGQLPFWMFGAIALICVGSTFLVARYLQFSNVSFLKKAKRSVTTAKPGQKVPAPAPDGYRKTPKELKPFSPTASSPFPVLPTFAQPIPPPATHADNPKRMHEQSARDNLIAWLIQDVDYTQPSLVNPLGSLTAVTGENSEAQPLVTVLPAEANHPLDWATQPAVNSVNKHRIRSLQAWLADM